MTSFWEMSVSFSHPFFFSFFFSEGNPCDLFTIVNSQGYVLFKFYWFSTAKVSDCRLSHLSPVLHFKKNQSYLHSNSNNWFLFEMQHLAEVGWACFFNWKINIKTEIQKVKKQFDLYSPLFVINIGKSEYIGFQIKQVFL